MEIEIGVGQRKNRSDKPSRQAFACSAVDMAGKDAVEIFAVLRHHIDTTLAEALDIEDREHKQRSPDLLRREFEKAEGRLYGTEFGAVYASRHEKTRSILRAFDDSKRQLEIRIWTDETLLDACLAGAEGGECGHDSARA